MIRRLMLVVMAVCLLAACDFPQLTKAEPVKATVVGKRTRKPSKMSRRYYVVVRYEGYEGRIRDREAYRTKEVGDLYDACLLTYRREKSGETFTELDACPS